MALGSAFTLPPTVIVLRSLDFWWHWWLHFTCWWISCAF